MSTPKRAGRRKTSPSGKAVPSYDDMLIPTLRALQNLGGSGNINEIYEQVIGLMNLAPEILEQPHGDTGTTEVEYRLAWSRTYLKKYGLISNSARGVWSLNSTETDLSKVDAGEIVRKVRRERLEASVNVETDSASSDESLVAEELAWEQEMMKVLLELDPAAFERLTQRLLRESGFVQVEVTGKSGDGGIDGVGIARINGFLSFHVLFQCKRYQGSVTPSQIRDFRGGMQGRSDKGLIITTGRFTRDAVKEATRDGAPPIDLIDGEQLVQRLKELGLGVEIQFVEKVTVDRPWFGRI